MHYHLDSRARLEHFFAQCYVEVGKSFKTSESFYYSVESLKNDSRFTDKEAESYGYKRKLVKGKIKYEQYPNEKEIANKKYSNRKDLGNGDDDDGWDFRGRGMIQLTGRTNYKNFTTKAREWGWIDDNIDFEKTPDLILQENKYLIMSAAYFWKDNAHRAKLKAPQHKEYNEHFKNKKCYEIADDNIKMDNEKSKAITYIVNRHTDSYTKRLETHTRIKNANIFKDFS